VPAAARPAARAGTAALILHLPGNIPVEVSRKDIRTLRLRVHAPDGRVTVSAPLALPRQAIDAFVSSRLDWIRKHRRRITALEYEPEYRYLHGERHWYAGRRYALDIVERPARARVELGAGTLVMRVRPGSGVERRRALLHAWYRQQLKATVPGLIDAYQPRMGVAVQELGIRRMKTRWGTCNPRARRIWLNLELAKKPPECLEYVVVHEMAHLLEPRHNARFHALMDTFLPAWREHRETLNRLPLQP
jgi:predicted metal-dependent hydrolase